MNLLERFTATVTQNLKALGMKLSPWIGLELENPSLLCYNLFNQGGINTFPCPGGS